MRGCIICGLREGGGCLSWQKRQDSLRELRRREIFTKYVVEVFSEVRECAQSSSGERGLQALTFDPDFSTNHYVYLQYTKKATSTTPDRTHPRAAPGR
jgi:hypothetical protein